MSHLSSSSERIVVVGGGFAGLAAAVRLAQAGLPVTVLEASKPGYAASTRNQGWLHSGAWFAQTDAELARLCHESLQQTIRFCPDCVEPDVCTMIYCSLEDQSQPDGWTRAWEQAGIPFEPVSPRDPNCHLPATGRDRISWALRLPDRSFRPDILLSRLASTARGAGAEIRPDTCVTGLLIDEQCVYGVSIGANEEVRARLVVLATGAYSQTVFSQLYQPIAGRQSNCQLVCLKSHLRAVRPGIGADPFCVVDGAGLNHLPHSRTSVFGTGRWQVVPNAGDDRVDRREIAILAREIDAFLPGGFGDDVNVQDWAGTTVQAMHLEQVHPGEAPLCTIVDHSQEPCDIENVISIFPGRATLWAPLAERVLTTVLLKAGVGDNLISHPPWLETG